MLSEPSMINAISTFALHSMGVVGSFGDVAVNSEANCQQTGMIREGVLYLTAKWTVLNFLVAPS